MIISEGEGTDMDDKDRPAARKLTVMKDTDGDYWIPYGGNSDALACLVVNEAGAYITDASDPLDSVTKTFGPLVRTELLITEVPDVSLTCDACLRDLHFCYECDDVCAHNHVHTEG